MKFIKEFFLSTRLLIILISLTLLFVISFAYPVLFAFCKVALYFVISAVFIDTFLLFSKKEGISSERKTPEKLSNGDENSVELIFKNNFSFKIYGKVLEEFPVELQKRNTTFSLTLPASRSISLQYNIRPQTRGEYHYGITNIIGKTFIGLVERNFRTGKEETIKVYPSFLQMKKYALLAFSNNLQLAGAKKIRRLGQNKEYEQIKEYVLGDDIRSINWKATARRDMLMVNQYQDEKSQQVFCLVDKGRNMKMPFGGLSLMDYAINASLVMSNISIQKQDKAGLITFSDKIGNILAASSRPTQMNTIQEVLYNQKTRYQESDFGRLYRNIKWNIKRRSLLLLFTNFESVVSMKRQLPYLRSIAKDHLLVVIFFKNSELYESQKQNKATITDVYEHTIAEKFIHEKELIIRELRKYGIQTILTEPENLTADTINKYLEIKGRGLI